MRPGPLLAAAAMGALLLAGAAHADPMPPASGPPNSGPPTSGPPPEDPLEAMNRRFYASHNGLDRTIFLPLAKLYRALTPGFIGEAIHNGLTNLSEPVAVANDILQGRIGRAAQDTFRIAANSTAGLGGILDVAAKAGFPHRDNDFGITLGRWGVRPGPYLFVPILGPTTVRDTIGEVADIFLNPMLYVRFPGHQTLEITAPIILGLDTRNRAEPGLETILSDATDPYATLRSVYLQSREAEVRGDTGEPALTPMEDMPSESPAPAAAPDQGQPPPDQAPPPGPSATGTPAPTPESTPAPGPELADGAADPDAPIATARPFDLQGGPAAVRGA